MLCVCVVLSKPIIVSKVLKVSGSMLKLVPSGTHALWHRGLLPNFTYHNNNHMHFPQKSIFSNAPVLATYDVNMETVVTSDASKVGLGATLTQIQEYGTRRPVSATSRSLTDTEQRYATIDKEGLRVFWTMVKICPLCAWYGKCDS